MNVVFKLLDEGAIIPQRAYDNAVGLDVYMPKTGVLKPGMNCIRLGISVEVPNGYMLNIYPRSSLAKKGIISILAPIDPGYTGSIHLIVLNTTGEYYHYNEGERLGQLVFHNIAVVNPISKHDSARGDKGLGSTGT